MNEWGIPDWRNPDEYGDTSSWNINQWKWQFLRRRQDLRDEFDARKEKRYQQSLALWKRNNAVSPDGVSPPDTPGFTVSTKLIGGILQSLPNPRISDQPYYAISWQDRADKWTVHGSEEEPDGFLRFDFDLSQPFEPQFRIARKAFLEFQKDRFGKTIQKRRHPDKWLTYLRVLDARQDGASWAEIAKILPHTGRTAQSARDTHRIAEGLCFNF